MRRTKISLYYQGSSTEGSARATTADEAHLFQKDQATTHKVCIVNLACQGYSFSSVWTPPTIFKTRLALPHLGGGTSTQTLSKIIQREASYSTVLATYLQFAGGTVGALVGWAPAPGQELAQSP